MIRSDRAGIRFLPSGLPLAFRSALLTALLLTACIPTVFAADGPSDEQPTPIAGREFRTTLFGEEVYVPPRDRRNVTAASFGLQWIPNGPSTMEMLPFGALYVWRNWDNDNRRFRGTFSGVVNDLNYTIGLRTYPNWSLVFTLNNFVAPLGRSEFVEGQRIRTTELEWSYAFAGAGFAYRLPVRPFSQDSAANISVTYEPGFRWFSGTKYTGANYGIPSDTYEGRIHFRLRVDAMRRNLMELPHEGVTFGGDALHGHRARWTPWGGAPFDTPDVRNERTYLAFTAYAMAATGLPFVESDKHRLISSIHAGKGKNLDRFSAFRLPGRPTGYEWEAVSLPALHGVAFNELYPRQYAIANLQYRYEALFFLYPYLEGSWGLVERPRFTAGGQIKNSTDSMPTLGGGIVSGAPWRSQIELNYSYNFGIFRDPGGGPPTKGGHGLFLFWSKDLSEQKPNPKQGT